MGFVYINSKDAISRLKKAFAELSPAQLNKSVARGINATLRDTKSDVQKNVRDKYNIPLALVNKNIFIVQSNYTNLSGSINIYRSTIPLKEFNPKEVRGNVITQRVGGRKNGAIASRQVSKTKPEGVYIEIIKGDEKLMSSAFFSISQGLRGSVSARGVYDGGFKFNSEERLRSLRGPSIYAMVMTGEIKKKAEKFVDMKFPINLERELEKRVKEMAAKGL